MTKPLHAGLAAQSGIVASILSQKNFTAVLDIFEVKGGFADLYSGQRNYDLNTLDFDTSNNWHLLSIGNVYKAYPCVAETHRAIDATLQLRSKYSIDRSDVERIDVGVWYLGPDVLIYPDPQTPLEAKFSMQHSVAAALMDGRVGLAQYKLDRLQDPEFRQLMNKINIYIHPEMSDQESWKTEKRFQEVQISMTDGEVLSERVYSQKGHTNNPMTNNELLDKFRECASQVFSISEVTTLIDVIVNLHNLNDVHQLTQLLSTKNGR
jgi:2-methylcitrate dehydratase PrpD